MRIIPKKTKMENKIWKCYSIIDLIGIGIFLASIILIALSNLKFKIPFAIIWAIFGVILFIPTGGDLLYRSFLQWIKYVFSKKTFNDKKLKNGKVSIDMLVPYKDILDDGTIKYPGYFAKVIEISSKEFELLSEDEQDMNIEDFSEILRYLENMVADIVKIDRPIIFDKWEMELERKIEVETNNTRKNILISRLMQIKALNGDEKIYRPFYYLVIYSNSIDKLDNILDNIKCSFEMAELEASILDKKETAVFLKYCNTREFDEREIEEISEDKYLDWIKASEIQITNEGYKIDDIWASTMAIEDYPLEVGNAWGAEIFNIDNTKVVMHINQVDQTLAIKRIDKSVNELLSREDSLNKASEVMAHKTHIDTMSELLASLQNQNEVLFDVSFTVTTFAYKKENILKLKKNIKTQIANKGFKINTLRNRQLEALINSNISKASMLKKFERGINSSSLAAVFPFVFSSIIEDRGILLGYNNYPVILDIWKRGKNYQNSNGMVIGSAGSGKSYFLKTLLSHLYSDNVNIFILDPENEYNILCNNLNGEMIDVGGAIKGRINPFHIYKILSEDGREASSAVVYSSHLRTLESFFRIIFEGASSEVLETINNAVTKMYYEKGINEDIDINNLKPEDFPTFEDLLLTLKTQEKNIIDGIQKGNILRAITYVLKFTKGGRYSNLWNGESTLKTDNDFTVFNFQSLFSNKNNVVANAQMLLVFRYLEQEIINQREKNSSSNIKQRTVIVADEAHLFIDSKYPIALEFFYQMTKRIRKYDGAFIPATQSISDWNSTEELRNKTTAILKESQYNFIFKLKPSGVDDLIDLYRTGSGINNEEARYLVKAKTGNMFFIGNDKEHFKFTVLADSYIKEIFENKNADVEFFTNFENNNDSLNNEIDENL